MIQTLIFDLGNVLLFFDHEKMIRQIASCCSIDSQKIKSLVLDTPLSKKYEKGELSAHYFYDLFRAQSPVPFDYQALLEAGSDIFTPNDLLISRLTDFKKQNIRLVLLSNTIDMHMDYILKKYTFLNLFDELILSYKVGMRKPEEGIYNKALEAAKCPKEATFFIDDLKENIDGAEKMGIPSHHFINTKQLLNHLSSHVE